MFTIGFHAVYNIQGVNYTECLATNADDLLLNSVITTNFQKTLKTTHVGNKHTYHTVDIFLFRIFRIRVHQIQ